MELEGLLKQLVAQLPKAQAIHNRNMEEEFGNSRQAGEMWATLEYGYDGDPRWHCGYRYQAWTTIGPVSVWALRAVGQTPAAAVRAMLEDLA